MENTQRAYSEESSRYTIGSEGHLIGGKSGERSWVLPIQAAYNVLWKKKVETFDFNCKHVGQGQAINLNVPYGVEHIPTGEQVLEAFKSCPFIRVSTIAKVKGVYGSGEVWHPWTNPPKYAFQIDKDDCTEEEKDSIVSFAEWIGANGVAYREKKPGVWSVNAVFHFSGYNYKTWAKSTIDSVLRLLYLETGIKVDDGGSKNDLIKNIWAIRTLQEANSMGLRLGLRFWDEKGPRGGLQERHYWFEMEDSTPMCKDPILNSHVIIWREECLGPWDVFRGKVEKEIQEREEGRESVENEPSPSTIQDRETIAENLNPPKTQFTPPKAKTKQNPLDVFGNYQTHSHDSISVLWWPDLKASVRKNGKLLRTEYDRIYIKWERIASNMTGKPLYSKTDRTWKERNWRTLSVKQMTWWEQRIGEVSYPTLRRKAGKLIRIARMAVDTNANSLLKDVAEKRLVEDDVVYSAYLQVNLRKTVKSKATLAEYRKVIKDPMRWVVMANEVLVLVEDKKKTKGEALLFGVVKDIMEEIEQGRESVENEPVPLSSSSSCFKEVNLSGRESVENEPHLLDKIQKRIETLKTQTEGDNEPQTKWTSEDEKWLHVEKVDNFNHLNTDLENRMMGREYIRDAERYHTEGLFSMRDEAVRAARSYGYIGGFSWESKQDSLDWAGIHSKVFKTEENPTETKAPKTTVSFADIRARLNRMKGAGNA